MQMVLSPVGLMNDSFLMWHVGLSKSLPQKKGFTSNTRIVSCVPFLEMCETMSWFGPVKNSVQKVEQFQQNFLASFAWQLRMDLQRSIAVHLTDQ